MPGLDVRGLLADRGDPSVADQAGAYEARARTDDVTSTPTILVGKSGKAAQPVTLSSPTDGEAVANAIDESLA